MNCFQLIKTVLDEAYSAIPGDDAAKDASITSAFPNLSKAYGNLLQEGCLDYADPCRRFAYIFKYTTTHANIVYEIIRQSQVLRELFDRTSVAVSCVGGGPGSDFLGVLKYCLNQNKTPELKCHILDRDPAWGESWSDVDSKVTASFRLSTFFNSFDVAAPSTWRTFLKHFQADLFTLIYFMSEVYAKKPDAQAYFETMMQQARSGALILFVDNRSHEFYEWFDNLAANNGFEIKQSWEGTFKLSPQEERRDLEPYFSRFNMSPKLHAEIAFRVAQKVEA